jgi:hypothetical protein
VIRKEEEEARKEKGNITVLRVYRENKITILRRSINMGYCKAKSGPLARSRGR